MSEIGENRHGEGEAGSGGGLGQHLILDLYECEVENLGGPESVRETMMAAAEQMGATVVTEEFHRFEPHGISGTVVISESHLTIHTWPEHAFAAVDVFSCATDVDVDRAVEHLHSEFAPDRIDIERLSRGASLQRRKAANGAGDRSQPGES